MHTDIQQLRNYIKTTKILKISDIVLKALQLRNPALHFSESVELLLENSLSDTCLIGKTKMSSKMSRAWKKQSWSSFVTHRRKKSWFHCLLQCASKTLALMALPALLWPLTNACRVITTHPALARGVHCVFSGCLPVQQSLEVRTDTIWLIFTHNLLCRPHSRGWQPLIRSRARWDGHDLAFLLI